MAEDEERLRTFCQSSISKFLTQMRVEHMAATYSRVVDVMAEDTSARAALLCFASMSFSTGSTTCTRSIQSAKCFDGHC